MSPLVADQQLCVSLLLNSHQAPSLSTSPSLSLLPITSSHPLSQFSCLHISISHLPASLRRCSCVSVLSRQVCRLFFALTYYNQKLAKLAQRRNHETQDTVSSGAVPMHSISFKSRPKSLEVVLVKSRDQVGWITLSVRAAFGCSPLLP